MLGRLIRFAIADRFGRSRRLRPRKAGQIDCADYVERFFPESVCQSSLALVPLNVTIGLDVFGPGGGRWSCRWIEGELQPVQKKFQGALDVVYRLDCAAFAAVVAGRLPLQEAFLARQIEITGDVEKGLKLAVLFDQFVHEFPYVPEVRHCAAGVSG
jgi:hypothetical protein